MLLAFLLLAVSVLLQKCPLEGESVCCGFFRGGGQGGGGAGGKGGGGGRGGAGGG